MLQVYLKKIIYSSLPQIILLILDYLPTTDLLAAGLTCQRWLEATQHPYFKSKIVLNFHKIHFSNDSSPITTFLNSIRDFPCITLDQVDFGHNFDAFWQQFGESVKDLTIKSCDIRGKTFYRILSQVNNLESLKIDQCRELFMSGLLFDSDSTASNSNNDFKFENLKLISITDNRYLSDSIFNRIVAIAPNITHLDMTQCHISFHKGLYRKFYPKQQVNPSESVLTFHYISQFIVDNAEQLKSLNFSRTLIDGAALTGLASIENLKLDRLELVRCDQLTNDGIINLVAKQNMLTYLNLSESTRLTDYSLINICNNLSELKTLKLRRCRAISDAGIKEMFKLTKLSCLDISECENVTDAGLVEVFAKTENKILREIFVSALNIAELTIIKMVQNHPNLIVLDLSYCFHGVTELAMQMILKYCRWLRILNLDYCDKVILIF